MATLSFDEFVKKAQGTPKDVQVLSQERKAIVEQRTGEFESAKAEEAKISSPFGQTGEFLRSYAETTAEATGIPQTIKRVAAGVAPAVLSKEKLPEFVEKTVGGVSEPRKLGGGGQVLKEVGVPEDIA